MGVEQTPLTALSQAEIATLDSLQQVDNYPLYTMHYQGAYESQDGTSAPLPSPHAAAAPVWGCSLFAALGDAAGRLYGRNFDWQYSPALLLFTAPPGAYASMAMVDIAYLGFGDARSADLTELPLEERRALLEAPFMPFDGMNERGLVVGMAAVPPGGMQPDPAKETIGSLGVIRLMLDHAADVEEALAILSRYNVDMEGGPPIHYLLADRSGRAALAEFYRGQLVVTENDATPWHVATNFVRAGAGASPLGRCQRYDRIHARLTETEGQLTPSQALDLLADVAQNNTQWSVVYRMTTGDGMATADVLVVLGRHYEQVHAFELLPSSQ
jgi:hypothetical protein